MAPREATGTFPDQFLTFDYDAAVPLGMQPQPPQQHAGDGLPLGLVGGNNGNNEGDALGTPPAGAAAPGGADALNHAGGENNGIGSPSTTSDHVSSRHSHGNSSPPVDPLSIDPTEGDEDNGDNVQNGDHHHHHHAAQPWPATEVSVDLVGGGNHHHHDESFPPLPLSPLSPAGTNNANAARRPFSPLSASVGSSSPLAAGTVGSGINIDAGSSSNAATATGTVVSATGTGTATTAAAAATSSPPLSTGTSYLHAASPTSHSSSSSTSRGLGVGLGLGLRGGSAHASAAGGRRRGGSRRGSSSTASGASSNSSQRSSPSLAERRRARARNLLSALDAQASLADDDDDHHHHHHHSDHHLHHQDQDQDLDHHLMMQVPRLERTFDSSTSTTTTVNDISSSSVDHHDSLPPPQPHASATGFRIHRWVSMDSSTAAAAASAAAAIAGPEQEDAEMQDQQGSVDGSDQDDQDQDALSSASSGEEEEGSTSSADGFHSIYRNSAFDDMGSDPNSPVLSATMADEEEGGEDEDEDVGSDEEDEEEGGGGRASGRRRGAGGGNPSPASPGSITLSFGPNTTVSDLKYFAERGCIVALLQALDTPRLVTLGTRMLADYAKMSHRRVAVASNRRILEFVQRTMLQVSEQADWVGREYAVETVRSLTATEESDKFLMGTSGLLNTLALVARGGPFVTHVQESGVRCTVPLASEKARLHACIAIMNLSCGKANKIEIAKVQDVLEAMRDVMLNSSDEARLKATTCVKNLSNADANDAALLGTPGLVEALGHVAAVTCSPESGATPCTTNACLALMNLSISKANKHRVYRTPGVMDALMTVLERTTGHASSTEARVKACSALSNLAIGYDNKIPMFSYPGFVEAILRVIQSDTGEARTKACSILWSFAAEMKNQVPVVQRGDILPVLVRVADEDGTTEARFKCVAALTLLAESLDNAIPLLQSGALHPLMDILHDAGPDPTQWKGQTASWCVGFLMNIAQSDEAVPALREAGVVELLAPLLTLDHYQSLKAAMAVTFCCRYDEGDECYDLLRKTENVIPKIISLLHNTLSGRGGNGYKYGVFTLRSSVGCISALASGPDFMKERIATGPVFESLLRVVTDFCVDGGTPGAIVGGGRDDALSATLAIRAVQSLTGHLIPIAGSSALPFGQSMEERLLLALESFEATNHPEIKDVTRQLATDARVRIEGGRRAGRLMGACNIVREGDDDIGDVASMASNCCGFESLPGLGEDFLHALTLPSLNEIPPIVSSSSVVEDESDEQPVRTFLLADTKTGRRFVVPTDPSGGRAFNDTRVWCYRRGRFCMPGEEPDPAYVWTAELQRAYEAALAGSQEGVNPSPTSVIIEGWSNGSS